ncbi:Uncharacterized protein FWK35_00021100 [Aphis craccivora]|uniref:Uncharacterized protein n=1 Tax=Aphis craccivora TaxID=307492 RepID=A0A6G0YNJ7_APHCR|nr:Uncharacterized protein FWK35_00021100 [Aphis craccivora]
MNFLNFLDSILVCFITIVLKKQVMVDLQIDLKRCLTKMPSIFEEFKHLSLTRSNLKIARKTGIFRQFQFLILSGAMNCRNNARISNFGGGFRFVIESSRCRPPALLGRSFFEFPNSFQKRREKPKKNDGKTGIFTQNQFSTKSIFLYGCDSKTNHCKYLKFSPNVYVMSIKNFWMTKG